jgi:hypothetical protein
MVFYSQVSCAAKSTQIYAFWVDCAPVNQPGSDQLLSPPGTEVVAHVTGRAAHHSHLPGGLLLHDQHGVGI